MLVFVFGRCRSNLAVFWAKWDIFAPVSHTINAAGYYKNLGLGVSSYKTNYVRTVGILMGQRCFEVYI